jgi:hypothetical protein
MKFAIAALLGLVTIEAVLVECPYGHMHEHDEEHPHNK